METLTLVLPFIVLALAIAMLFVWNNWLVSNFDYQCGFCGRIFSLTIWQAVAAPHMMWRKLMRCPHCGNMAWATPVRK